jgi:hypothetical protein
MTQKAWRHNPMLYDAVALSINLSIINLLHVKEKNSCIYTVINVLYKLNLKFLLPFITYM